MANLETLELTITSNAQVAKKGIDDLVQSLSALPSVVRNSVRELEKLNGQLSKLKKYTGFNLSGSKFKILSGVGGTSSSGGKPVTGGTPGLPPGGGWKPIPASQVPQDVKDSILGGTSIERLKKGFNDLTKGASTFFSKVKRIATTMLIRSAIRGVIASLKEGQQNLYEWSKLNNGEFAKSLDTIKSKASQLKNSIGASISPLIQAAIPLLQTLANAAINAFNWLNQLLSMLSGKSYWTKATEGADDFTDSAKKASGAAKDWLASFDELNVMSQAGGGGGTASTASEYADMFENVYTFDSTVRDVVGFLKENMESIKAMAVATGVAILGWKISQAFSSVLPALSKIAGLIGVGAVIGITLQANWMLTNKYLETGKEGWLIASALTTAIGATGAGILAQKIFGGQAGVWVASITLAFSAITDIVANVKNTDVSAFDKKSILTNIKAALSMGAAAGVLLYTVGGLAMPYVLAAAGGVALVTFGVATALKLITQKNNIGWGDIKLTESQIKEYVNDVMFTTPVDVLINKFNVMLTDRENLETSIKDKLKEIQINLDVLKLGIDKTETLNNIATIIGGDENGNGGLIKDITDMCDMNISLLKLNFSQITAYDGEGNPISSDTLLAGVEGWNKVKSEMEANGKELTELLVSGAKGELTPEMEAYTQELLTKVMNMSQQIANAQEFGKMTADFKTKLLSAFEQGSFEGIIAAFKDYSSGYEEQIRKSLQEEIASWYALSELETDPVLKAKYKGIADDLSAGFEDTVQKELAEKTAPGQQMIQDWILGKHEKGSASVTWNKEYIKDMINMAGLEGAVDEVLRWNDFTQQEIDLTKLVGFSWDMLTDDLKKQFIANIKIDSKTIEELKAVGVPAKDIVEIADWKSFTNQEKLDFLDALKKSFGSKEAIKAAKDAGINVGDVVKEGMSSKDANIKQQAESWNKIIDNQLKDPHKITVKEDTEATKKVAKSVKKTIEDSSPTISPKVSVPDSETKAAKTAIEKVSPTITTKTQFATNTLSDMKKTIESINPIITANVKAGDLTAFGNAIKDAVVDALKKVKITVNTDGTLKIETKAEGGLVRSGDLFIANENGTSEMIGRFGGNAAVANQEQMVEAMARGVQYAQAEQNSLLREQNTLLRGILAKEGSVNISPSSAFGRVIRKSAAMYGATVGG